MLEQNPEWDEFRKPHPLWGDSQGDYGYFERGQLRIISSGAGDAWEHVSVTKANHKTPTWDEMCLVKDMFWGKDEVVFQFHAREQDYVNYHSACLHLWKPAGINVPTPPTELLGPVTGR